jgi:hypothetical protein
LERSVEVIFEPKILNGRRRVFRDIKGVEIVVKNKD